MKISNEDYAVMREAMRAVVDLIGANTLCLNGTRELWAVWHAAENSLRYDDTHPFFVNGRWQRVVPYHPGFDLYKKGLNDTHIETALRKIGRELELI